MGAASVAWGRGPGPHSDEPYGEEPWDSHHRSHPLQVGNSLIHTHAWVVEATAVGPNDCAKICPADDLERILLEGDVGGVWSTQGVPASRKTQR